MQVSKFKAITPFRPAICPDCFCDFDSKYAFRMHRQTVDCKKVQRIAKGIDAR